MKRSGTTHQDGLESELRSWWEQQEATWDGRVDSSLESEVPGETGLWDAMPTIDSKVVTETSPIFERHLGMPLDVTKIKRGGYSDIEDLISDLVPKMRELAQVRKSKDTDEGRDSAEEEA